MNEAFPGRDFFSQTPYLSGVVKWLGGVAPQRSMPVFRQHRPWRPTLKENVKAAAGRAGERGTTVSYKDVPRFQSDSFSDQQAARRLNPQASEPPLDSRRVMLFPETFTMLITTKIARGRGDAFALIPPSGAILLRPVAAGLIGYRCVRSSSEITSAFHSPSG